MYRLSKFFIFIIFILFSFTINVKAIVQPTNEFYVNDYADILSDKTEQYIIEKSKILNNIDGTQIVVVTVKSLEGLSLEQYSLTLARNFKIGSAEKNNGLLLLLALEERKFRVEVGYGLEGILSDGKTGRFQDIYIIPYLRENKWDEGIKNGYDAFYSEIVKQNNLMLDYNNPIYIEPESNSLFLENVIWIMMWFIIFGFVFGGCASWVKKKKKRKKFIMVYLVVWGITFIVILFSLKEWIIPFVIHIILFFYGLFGKVDSRGNGSRSGFGNGSSGGRSGGSSGGGGSFGGGGSSRGF